MGNPTEGPPEQGEGSSRQDESPSKPPKQGEGPSKLPEQVKENSGGKKINGENNEKSDLCVDVGQKVVPKETVETAELSAASEENIEAQVSTKKRKQKENSSQAKKVAVSEEGEKEEEMVVEEEEVKEAEEEESEEDLMEEDEEDEEEEDCAEASQPLTDSQLKSPFFKVQQIKDFLRKTKNKRGVNIEEFFTDKSLF